MKDSSSHMLKSKAFSPVSFFVGVFDKCMKNGYVSVKLLCLY